MATLGELIAHDYEVMDGVVNVELRDERGTPVASFLACKGLRRSIRLATAVAAGLGIADENANWHVWVVTLGGAKPQRGWVLVETQNGGKRWSVMAASLETLDTRYRLTCTAEV